MADKNHLLLVLALGKEIAEKTEKLPAIPLGSKQDRAIQDQKRRRGGPNSPNRS